MLLDCILRIYLILPLLTARVTRPRRIFFFFPALAQLRPSPDRSLRSGRPPSPKSCIIAWERRERARNRPAGVSARPRACTDLGAPQTLWVRIMEESGPLLKDRAECDVQNAETRKAKLSLVMNNVSVALDCHYSRWWSLWWTSGRAYENLLHGKSDLKKGRNRGGEQASKARQVLAVIDPRVGEVRISVLADCQAIFFFSLTHGVVNKHSWYRTKLLV